MGRRTGVGTLRAVSAALLLQFVQVLGSSGIAAVQAANGAGRSGAGIRSSSSFRDSVKLSSQRAWGHVDWLGKPDKGEGSCTDFTCSSPYKARMVHRTCVMPSVQLLNLCACEWDACTLRRGPHLSCSPCLTAEHTRRASTSHWTHAACLMTHLM